MLMSDFGVSTPMPGQQDPTRRNLEICIPPPIEAKLRALDEKIATLASERSMEFFNTATLNKQHVPVLRTSTNGKPVIRVKVATAGDSATTVRSLKEDNESTVFISPELVGRNTLMIAVVDTPGIWSSPSQFGLSFTARGLIVRLSAPKAGLGMFTLKRKLVDVAPSPEEDETPAEEAAPAAGDA